MMRRITALVTAFLFLFMCSCSTTKLVNPNQIKNKKDHIVAVALKSGEIVEFDTAGGRLDLAKQQVTGKNSAGKEVTIPFEDVVTATVQRSSVVGGIFGGLGVVVLFVFVVLLIASATADNSSSGSSCPYVYSFDGDRYVLDAEPLSGAISKGLERNDLCRLDHLRAHDGRYELMVRNELEETQYLDGFALRLVDHPVGSLAYPDIDGTIHVVNQPVAATSARDERGVDLRRIVAKEDQIPWQSIMPIDESWRDMTLRHELTFSFPKPSDATRGQLIVNAATSQWGSIMMREMMQARGEKLSAWRASVDANGPAMQEMIAFNTREEIYFLKLYVREGDQWVQRGWIPGGSPAVAETRVIPVDLSGVNGDQVTIKVEPPRGFWSFDYLAMSYDEAPILASTEIPLQSALLGDGTDITSTLGSDNGTYHQMRNVGDTMMLEFAAPAKAAKEERTVFLDTRGYYHSHIDEKQPEQTALIDEMLKNDGAITRYSLQKFVEFATRTTAKR